MNKKEQEKPLRSLLIGTDGKRHEIEIKLSEESKKELEDLKKKLGLDKFSDTIICSLPLEDFKKLEQEIKQEQSSGVSGLLEGLREELSDLEHEQWMVWSKSVTSQVMDNKVSAHEVGIAFQEKHLKWLPNWKPYDELDKKTKDFDRVWADKVLELIECRVTELLEAKRKELKERFREEDLYYTQEIRKIIDEVFSQQTVRQGSETSSVS